MTAQVAAPAATPTAPTAPPQPRLLAPLVLILLAVVSWALVLNNGIFIDESLYIRTGRAYIEHWSSGTPLPVWIGEGFSGLPMLYPVLAGALDMVGGLALVRVFSLLCVIVTMLLLRSIASQLFNRRAGLVTAAVFGLTGPVLYIAHLGTFDALVILLLVTAWWVGMQLGWGVAPLMGLLLALAVATKYTAYVFVPSILVLSTFSTFALTHTMPVRLSWWRVRRALYAGLIAAGLLAVGYLMTNQTIRDGLAFTTTGRAALSPVPRGQLVGTVPDFVWPTFFAALLGMVWLVRDKRWNAVLWGVVLIGTSLLLPTAQIMLGEEVSFQKHLAYSAAFLAPLAGWGFARPWKLAIWTPVLIWWLILMGVWGAFRSHDLILYPDVRPVVEKMEFTDGTYLSSSADSLSYYTREDGGVQWRTTFSLYIGGAEKITQAIEEKRYDAVILSAGSTGSTIQDASQRVLLDAMQANNYRLTRAGENLEWLIYRP